ncbi:MAG: 23S rRNA (pseudouridine(1915)-N(3))-methyltransferase RlmH [Pseudomonadota bacterium]
MRLHIIAVGALKRGPERELVEDYLSRLRRIGPSIGIQNVVEYGARAGGGSAAEAERLAGRIPGGASVITLDEGGDLLSSKDLARLLAQRRDGGAGDLCFLIGGAEGHGPAVTGLGASKLAFGPQTWPHKLVRVMLCEQLYRAGTLLLGTPYHKA